MAENVRCPICGNPDLRVLDAHRLACRPCGRWFTAEFLRDVARPIAGLTEGDPCP